jgi:uncharacterized membrane protein
MPTLTMTKPRHVNSTPSTIKIKRVESIDFLRGTVMIIMALDHVRDYFHADAFVYEPTDLSRTSVFLFFTRFITHYCAPVFVFLAGTSAYLYGTKKSKKELSFFLLTRGIWLILAELFILSLFRTFNPAFTYIHLQVIWAIGISMMILAAVIYMSRPFILLTGILIIATHNLLDNIHVPGNGILSFLWAVVHEPAHFTFGHFSVFVHYPLVPWIGIMIAGYYFGQLYIPGYDPAKRKKILLYLGSGAIILFIILRSGNFYGDAAHWSAQKNTAFSLLSFLNVTKYPPSLLYTLITLGPAIIFLAVSEKPLNALKAKITVFGRVPMFYYLAHILLIHFLATIGAIITGYKLSDMILSSSVQSAPALKGYGFNLFIVYVVWIALILMLYPFCKWFSRYKIDNQSRYRWLSYL